MKSIFKFLPLSMVLLAFPAFAEKAANPLEMDVAGVKLGMDYPQAVTAAAEHFHVTSADINSEALEGEGRRKGHHLAKKTVQMAAPDHFIYRKDGTSLTVHFVLRVPQDKAHSLAVDKIVYEMPKTKENIEGMFKAAMAKYGHSSNSQDFQDRPGQFMEWCAHPALSGKMCENQPSLVAYLSRLTLSDPKLKIAQDEFMGGKPNF